MANFPVVLEHKHKLKQINLALVFLLTWEKGLLKSREKHFLFKVGWFGQIYLLLIWSKELAVAIYIQSRISIVYVQRKEVSIIDHESSRATCFDAFNIALDQVVLCNKV